jgi:hypothetical protein
VLSVPQVTIIVTFTISILPPGYSGALHVAKLTHNIVPPTLRAKKGQNMDQLDQFLDAPASEEVILTETAEDVLPEATAAPEEIPPAPIQQERPDVEGMKAAMMAERRKRQELEQLLAQRQEEERPFLGEEYEARFKETEARFQQELVKQKLDLSESFARAKHEDFDEKLDIFSQLVSNNPALYTHMAQQVNPAEFAYKVAADQLQLKEMANPTEYKAKIEAEIRAKLEAEYAAKYKSGNLPPTLAEARGGASSMRTAEWAGPASIKDILK